MAVMELTDDIVSSLHLNPAINEKILPQYAWDTTTKGFGVRLLANLSRVFVFKTTLNGKPWWEPLGDWPTIKVEEARKKVQEFKKRIHTGESPSSFRLKPILWGDLLDKFEDLHYAELSEKTVNNYKSVISCHIRERWEKKLAHEITFEDIHSLYKSMKNIPRQANVALMLLEIIFERAEGWTHREYLSNPVVMARKQGLRSYPENVRDRKLSKDELGRLGTALKKMDEDKWKQFANIFRVLFLSGGRLNEILALRWDMIKLDEEIIAWEESKTGKMEKVLTEALFDVIKQIPRFEGSPYVFPSTRNSTSGHVIDIKRPWIKLLELAKIDDFTRHDLRHNYGKATSDDNFCLQITAALLGHKDVRSTGRYSKPGTESTRKAANKIGRSLSKIL